MRHLFKFKRDTKIRPAIDKRRIFRLAVYAIVPIAAYYGLQATGISLLTGFARGIMWVETPHKAGSLINLLLKNKKIDQYNAAVEKFANEIEDMNLPDQYSKVMAVREKFWSKGIYGDKEFEFKDKSPGFWISRETRRLSILDNTGVCRHVAAFACDVYRHLGINAKEVTVNSVYNN